MIAVIPGSAALAMTTGFIIVIFIACAVTTQDYALASSCSFLVSLCVAVLMFNNRVTGDKP